jgi:hypothetical protein
MTQEELTQKIGVECFDNTETYFEEGVELVGLTESTKIFMIDDPIGNPKGYGFEINLNLEKGTFKFVYDGCGIKIDENKVDMLNPEVYKKVIEIIAN